MIRSTMATNEPPPCTECGDEAGLELDGKRMCRECWHEAMVKRIVAGRRPRVAARPPGTFRAPTLDETLDRQADVMAVLAKDD